jgi:hypothetical protein
MYFGLDGVSRHYCNGEQVGVSGTPSSWVNYVVLDLSARIPPAVVHSRGSDPFSIKRQYGQVCIRVKGVCHSYGPACQLRRRSHGGNVSTGIHQARPHLGKGLGRPVSDPTLGDPSQVDATPFGKDHRPSLGV